MPFSLRDVGSDCFTLAYDGKDVGAVFSPDDDHPLPWVAVLWERRFQDQLPVEFTSGVRRFESFAELRQWLGLRRQQVAA